MRKKLSGVVLAAVEKTAGVGKQVASGSVG
jgi:hypothetical protein